MKTVRWGLGRSVWFVVVLTLAACGGPGTPSGQPPILSESDFVFTAAGQLPAEEFDANTTLGLRIVTQVVDNTLWTGRHRDEFHLTDDSGSFAFPVDARTFPADTDPITPVQFIQWFLPDPEDGDHHELYATDPHAELKILWEFTARQKDPAGGGGSTESHVGYFEMSDGGVARAVFSERVVRITGGFSGEDHFYDHKVDVSLAPGWNLVYQKYDFESRLSTFHARKLQADDLPRWYENEIWLGRVTGLGIYGYAVFPRRETGVTMADELSSRRSLSETTWIYTPNWLGFATQAGTPLRTLSDAFSEAGFMGSITLEEPKTSGFIADVYLYDEETVNSTNRWSDPNSSFGKLLFKSESGNPVWLVYSDRSTTLHANGTLGETTVKSQALGLELQFGWNPVELRPSPTEANTDILVTYNTSVTDGEVIMH